MKNKKLKLIHETFKASFCTYKHMLEVPLVTTRHQPGSRQLVFPRARSHRHSGTLFDSRTCNILRHASRVRDLRVAHKSGAHTKCPDRT